MRLVIQRVSRGAVSVDGQTLAEVGKGLIVLCGVGQGDTDEEARWLAEKTAHMRLFEDEAGKTNLSVLDVKGAAIVVSQFTLYADMTRGRRPGFSYAAPPELAEPLVRRFAAALAGFGVPVQTGIFGAHMLVEIHNDGPVTILLHREQESSGVR